MFNNFWFLQKFPQSAKLRTLIPLFPYSNQFHTLPAVKNGNAVYKIIRNTARGIRQNAHHIFLDNVHLEGMGASGLLKPGRIHSTMLQNTGDGKKTGFILLLEHRELSCRYQQLTAPQIGQGNTLFPCQLVLTIPKICSSLLRIAQELSIS